MTRSHSISAPTIPAPIDYFRALSAGNDDARARAEQELREAPGRAAGRVAGWSLTRAYEALRRFSRRPLRWGARGAPLTPHERSLMNVFDALAAGDEPRALAAAEWIVTAPGGRRLVERLAPAAESLARAA